MERRLAAILAADIVGYSRLMGEDEGRTLSALRGFRDDLFVPTVTGHRGVVIKSMGDGWLVEFASVVDAINCAVIIQNELKSQELLKLRIGINVGDIVRDGDDVFGDGVNVCARLQEIAAPGGIAVSEFAHDSAKGIIDHEFADGGSKSLKNIAKPVRVFTWAEGVSTDAQTAASSKDRPNIIVLPFTLSGNADENAWLADGLTDALITALSRFSWFLTLARNISLACRGQAVDIEALRRKWNVSYALEGSLRVSGPRVRVNAQLLDAGTGHPIWTGQLDGTNDDPFELEDKISRSILAELTTRLLDREQRKARFGGDGSAWDLVMQGRRLLWHVNQSDVARARDLFLKAIEMEPDRGLGQSDLAWCYIYQRLFSWADDIDHVTSQAIEAADKAVAADEYDAYALATASQTRISAGRTDDAIALARRAIAINPHQAIAYAPLALGLCQQGRYEEAIEPGDMALNITPNDPVRSIARAVRGIYMLMLDRHDDMVENARELIREFPGMPTGHRQLAVAYALSDRVDEARQVVDEHILRLLPGHTATESGRALPFGRNEDIRARWVGALVKAGLPE